MKKVFIITILLLTFIFVTASTMAETVEKDKGYISVNLSTIKEISPNQAEISIGIETSDKSLQKASNENKAIANKVYSTLKSLLGVDDYIKTNNYSARPQYTYTKENKKILDKYVVSSTVTIKTKKIDLVSMLIDDSIAQGATNIENLQFNAVDYDGACNDALSEITKKAYTQAGTVAKSINSQLTGIKAINVTCNTDTNPRPMYVMAMKNAMDNASATPIESGKIKIYANIDASFYVK